VGDRTPHRHVQPTLAAAAPAPVRCAELCELTKRSARASTSPV
jgi:hypothetical protein